MPLRPVAARHRARTPVLAVALAAILAGGLTAAPTPAEAENPVPAAPPAVPLAPPSPDLPGLPTSAPELAEVPVAGTAFSRAIARYGETASAHAEVQARRADLDRRSTALQGRAAELDAVRVATDARVQGMQTRLAAVEAAIQELAVASFVSGGDQGRINRSLASTTPALSEEDRKDVLGGLSMEVLLAERAAYRARIDDATARGRAATDERSAAQAELAELDAVRPAVNEGEHAAAAEVATERVAYEEARMLATVEGVDFSFVALDAYYRAAATMVERRRGCGVRWWGLAGVALVEGRHGTFGGASLQPNGDADRRIIGVQLNGTLETAAIGDSDGGALDGDAAFDRAVGPMQFIPQTWQRFQADGNDDGTRTPFNLYDATLAAADYLCTASGGLDGDAGLRSAYLSYNHSLPYAETVLGHARRYQRTVEVPEPDS